MRGRTVVVLALAAAALGALPAEARAAARWTGVIVAKDPARGAVVTASAAGRVRTLRASARAPRLRVGQRLAVLARPLADGTFRARRVRVAGWAAKARLRAVVVRRDRTLGRYLVSAGGSVLSVRSGGRALASAAGQGPQPGDQVVIAATLSGGTPTATEVQTVGHVNVVELEGIFLSAQGGVLRLAVASRGEVTVTVPAGMALPPFRAGDEVELAVAIDASGAFTLVSAQGDNEEESEGVDVDEDSGELEVEGTITALSSASITVQPGKSGAPVTCAIPTGVSLTGVAAGDRVGIKCALLGTTLSLTELEREHADEDEGQDEELEAKGTISALSGSSITVQPAAGAAVTCAIPSGVNLSSFKVGDRVQIECRTLAGTPVLKEIDHEDDEQADDDEGGDDY